MSATAVQPATRQIVVDEVFPHAVGAMWKALTDPELMARWLMKPTGFEPVVGNRFTFQTTPAGDWDGTIRYSGSAWAARVRASTNQNVHMLNAPSVPSMPSGERSRL